MSTTSIAPGKSGIKQWAQDVWEGFTTVLGGMNITWRHLFTQNVTLQYPEEKWQLPPRSRMRLFMKYEDCIGCGQCARACPVQCISIKADKRDPKAPAIFAANGQGIKLDVTVFDIDMSLCCYCNLCTYPCPTNCIYMTPEYEFATDDLTRHLYHFAKKDAKFLTVKPGAPAATTAAAKPAAPTPAAAAAAKAGAAAAAPTKPAAPSPPDAPAVAGGTPAGRPTPAAPPRPEPSPEAAAARPAGFESPTAPVAATPSKPAEGTPQKANPATEKKEPEGGGTPPAGA